MYSFPPTFEFCNYIDSLLNLQRNLEECITIHKDLHESFNLIFQLNAFYNKLTQEIENLLSQFFK